MMRGAHFSDIHYAGATLEEVDRCFTFAVDAAIHRGVEFAVISGDSTDHALDIHAPAVEALARNIRRLADHCPVLMLQGTFSHEPPGTLNLFRLLGGKYPVHVADRLQQVALLPGGVWRASDGWRFDAVPEGARALFSCVPVVNKAVIAAAVGATEAARAVGEQLSLLLRGLAASNETARRRGIATIGVSHGTVYGCLAEHDVPMAGFDHEFTTGALFAAGATAFMLGHIHKHQAWIGNGRVIAYAGSIGRLHYGEQGDKGFLLWEVGADDVRYALVKTPSRRTIDIMFDGMPDLDRLRQVVRETELAGAFVRVRWAMPEEDSDGVDRAAIERLFADAAQVKLAARVIPVVRTRAAGISHLASVAAKVRAWADVTEAQAEPLLACLEVLHMQTPEEVAVAILAPPAPVASAPVMSMTEPGGVADRAVSAPC
ncbi:MAG TPA: metallophosphatase family protein [Noviherbaspirillum sp.]